MRTSDRSPKANAYGLLAFGFLLLVLSAVVRSPILLVAGIAALIGASHYLKVATEQERKQGEEPDPTS